MPPPALNRVNRIKFGSALQSELVIAESVAFSALTPPAIEAFSFQ